MVIGLTTMTIAAQTNQVATLSHQNEISIYYGATALGQAVASATDGDVITLSAGQFDGIDLDKELTVRGAGLDLPNFATGNSPTVINGAVTLKGAKIRLEGLNFNQSVVYAASALEVTAEKCQFLNYAPVNSTTNCTNTFVNCVLSSSFGPGSCNAVNCVFQGTPSSYIDLYGNYLNCIFILDNNTGNMKYLSNGTYQNCIFTSTGKKNYRISASSLAYNCLFTGANGGKSITNTSLHSTNLERQDIETPFKEDTFYQLAEEFKTFVTSDNTEVGIYGGNIGFTQTPNVPRINTFRVSPRTSADGKLSVEIEVEGVE